MLRSMTCVFTIISDLYANCIESEDGALNKNKVIVEFFQTYMSWVYVLCLVFKGAQ